ncbi:MAG: type II secretion system GspH family protein [Sulfurimonas sp.]|nr:type II secretion system GspH family protein [Sulfurimonas sp.]
MKKAFTMIELIFVIVIIGILAAVIIPRSGSNKLYEAATQVVSHIRYTQHLAMVDDKFNPSDNEWYKRRWQLLFGTSVDTNNKVAYSIFSDKAGGSTGNPDTSEIATNPLNNSKLLSGGFSGTLPSISPRATSELNIGQKYGILDVDFSSECSVNDSKRIAFDYLGRPIYGNISSLTSPFKVNATNRLIINQCKIEICSVSDCTTASSEEKVTIAIEPETGYAHIL